MGARKAQGKFDLSAQFLKLGMMSAANSPYKSGNHPLSPVLIEKVPGGLGIGRMLLVSTVDN